MTDDEQLRAHALEVLIDGRVRFLWLVDEDLEGDEYCAMDGFTYWRLARAPCLDDEKIFEFGPHRLRYICVPLCCRPERDPTSRNIFRDGEDR